MNPKELLNLLKQGVNVSKLLREQSGINCNTEDIVELAFDLQAGMYIDTMNEPKHIEYKSKYNKAIANIINELGKFNSILEPGIGEGTTIVGVANNLLNLPKQIHGFDISWSALALCKQWLNKTCHLSINLSQASMFKMPYLDNSFDVVYTSYAVGHNTAKVEIILKELYRVTREYLILIEPCANYADSAAKKWMQGHAYCTNIYDLCVKEDFDIIESKLFPVILNPLNPCSLIVVKKSKSDVLNEPDYVCPKYHTLLERVDNFLYSKDSLIAYPILKGIPCLQPERGIVASKLMQIC